MKIALLGEGAVGKTALRERFLGKEFSTGYVMTIGADFAIKQSEVETPTGSKAVKFQIWDLAGQPRFSSVRSLYYRGSHGGLLLFDLTRRDSLHKLSTWVDELFRNSGKGNVPLAVIGNKVDLRDESEEDTVSSDEAREFIKSLEDHKDISYSIPYLETSAKTGQNVDEAFSLLAKNIIDLFGK